LFSSKYKIFLDKKKEYCESIAKKIQDLSELPAICEQYEGVKATIKNRKTLSDPFAGMPGANRARADRSHGIEHHAKIQRRVTSGATTGVRRFSKLDK
jgi:hypothetical protein